MEIIKYLFDIWGIFCGIILLIGFFYEINILFDLAIGGGGSALILSCILNIYKEIKEDKTPPTKESKR